jgi:hypothetical protein
MSAGASKVFCSPLIVSIVAIRTPELCGRGQRTGGEAPQISRRCEPGREDIFRNADLHRQHHIVVRRGCISFKRTDTMVVIECARLLRHVN